MTGPSELQRCAALALTLAWFTVATSGCSPTAARNADNATPSISAVAATGIGSTSATIAWTTNEPSDSQVEYGVTAGYGQFSAADARLTRAHAAPLTGLQPATVYHYRIKSKDAAGNLATSSDFTFTTRAGTDTVPPAISSVVAASITDTAALISWITDEASDSQVDFGTTTSYGRSSAVDGTPTTSHAVGIGGLTASTLYHYRVRSNDAAGNAGTSVDFTFTTAGGPDDAPPAVAMTAPSPNATVSGVVTVSADASDNVAVAAVRFLLDGTQLGQELTALPFATSWNTTQSTDGTHSLVAVARDAAGNQASSAPVAVMVANNTGVQLELAPAIGGFTFPLDMQAPADGTGRLFVVEQGGGIRVVLPGGVLLPAPFVDISSRPGFTSGGETGLLGLAFHPNYATNGRFFVNYTRMAGAQLQTVIAEFRAAPASSNTADAATERILFTVDQPFANHNGGGLAFGAEGFLYIALGDGGGGGDPFCNAQNVATLLGKIVRIDVNATPPGQQYAIPSGNPFAGQPNARGEIWLLGLRNPFRFSFDRANGADLYIGDVGQNAFEEVDMVSLPQSGANLGWNLLEGTHPFSATCTLTGSNPVPPIFDYPHAAGDSTVTGGYVYRGASIPALVGQYVFGDFGSGRVWTLARNAQGSWTRSPTALLDMGAGNLSSFGQAQDGELYVVRYSSGEIARIRQVGRPSRRAARRF